MDGLTGRHAVLPVELQNGQRLDVLLDADGRFVCLRETMPPLTNYARLRMVDEASELAKREHEWAALRAVAFSGAEHPNYRDQHQRVGDQTV